MGYGSLEVNENKKDEVKDRLVQRLQRRYQCIEIRFDEILNSKNK